MLLSVIIPVYNVENYIIQCLNSILYSCECFYDDIEIIIVNDGSTDTSHDKILSFIEAGSNIRYFIKDNGGLSDARNYGIKKSTGKYITFIDSDDVISPSYFEDIFEVIRGYKYDIVSFDYQKFFQDRELTLDDTSTPLIKCFSQSLSFYIDKPVFAWNKVYKKSLFDNIQFPVGKCYEDVWTIPLLLARAKSFCHTEKKLYGYRQRNGSITFKKDNSYLDILEGMHFLVGSHSIIISHTIGAQLFTLILISLRMGLSDCVNNLSKITHSYSSFFYSQDVSNLPFLKKWLFRFVVNFPVFSKFLLLALKPLVNVHYFLKLKKLNR